MVKSRARALKKLIRARAAKTGERHTTAVTSSKTKGGLSDAVSRAKTGRGLDHWFEVLDRFGAVEKGHTAAARHLYDAHGVDGWYAQGITVAYERARDVRAVNQRRDGGYEVSVSKVLPVGTADAVKAFTDHRRRQRWLEAADRGLVTALSTALRGSTSKGTSSQRPAGSRPSSRSARNSARPRVSQSTSRPKPAGVLATPEVYAPAALG